MNSKTSKILLKATKILAKKGILEPFTEAKNIILHLMKPKNYSQKHSLKGIPYLWQDCRLPSLNKYFQMIYKRTMRFPLAYLLSEQEFMGLRFKVTPQCFIPRQETEILVEEAIKLCHNNRDRFKQTTSSIQQSCSNVTSALSTITCLDIGTGCGNIAISLAKYVPEMKIIAVDISQKAIKVAIENAKYHNVDDKITFVQGDIFYLLTNKHKLLMSKPRTFAQSTKVNNKDVCVLPTPSQAKLRRKYTFIVSNPPYISYQDYTSLMPEILFEPRVALYGGSDGVEFYRRIIPLIKPLLLQEGFVLLEIGYNQRQVVRNILLKNNFTIFKELKDYAGFVRIVIATH